MTTTRKTLPDDLRVTQALRELDARMPAGMGKVNIKVVGGYALLVRGVRQDADQATDIDYIGHTLPVTVSETVGDVGRKYGLGSGWLNNDVMLSGMSDVDDIELSTGPLTFEQYDSNLNHFTVEVADETSLMRMKLVAIDTSMASYLDDLNPTGFVRSKDFGDISLLCAGGYSDTRLKSLVDEMALAGNILEPGATLMAARLAAKGKNETEILEAVAEAKREGQFSDADDDLEDFDWETGEVIGHDEEYNARGWEKHDDIDPQDSVPDSGGFWPATPPAPPSPARSAFHGGSQVCGAITQRGTRCQRRGDCPHHR